MRLAGVFGARALRILQVVSQAAAVCVLFSHAAAYSQGAAASVANPSASSSSAPVVLPKTIPFKQDSAGASDDASPSAAAIALVLLLGLAGFALWAWRRRVATSGAEGAGKGLRWWGLTPTQKSLLLHSTTRLSPRHSVHEIEWRGRRLLIGCADQTMTLLAERAVAESADGAAAPTDSVTVPPEDKP